MWFKKAASQSEKTQSSLPDLDNVAMNSESIVFGNK